MNRAGSSRHITWTPEAEGNIWKMAGLSFDVSRVPRIMYEEVFFIVALAGVALVGEHLLKNTLMENQGSAWLLLVPLSFIGISTVIRPYETNILKKFSPCPLDFGASNRRSPQTPSDLRIQRIFQNIILLGLLAILNLGPIDHLPSGNLFEGEFLQWTFDEYLKIWLLFARSFQGACALALLVRLYSDIAIQSSTFLTGYPSSDLPLPPDDEPVPEAAETVAARRSQEQMELFKDLELENMNLNDVNANVANQAEVTSPSSCDYEYSMIQRRALQEVF